MDTEIELKFVLADIEHLSCENVTQSLTSFLNPYLSSSELSVNTLSNTYFDTAEQKIRSFDFGLRVRTVNGKAEQTIKTAGQVVGGLHKRPEYNIDITADEPDLSLFPAEIWPEYTDIQLLQSELIPLFTTEFVRQKWLVGYEGCSIEVVFDKGQVSTQSASEDIREIELELLDGDVRQLIKFSQLLTAHLPMRLSNDSKAARGYRLFHNKSLENKELLGTVALNANDSLEDAFVKSLKHGIEFWQHHEAVYCQSQKLSSLKSMIKGIWLVRHTLWLYRQYVPENASGELWDELKWLMCEFDWLDEAFHIKQLTSKKGNFRKRIAEDSCLIKHLEESRTNLQLESDIEKLFYSERYNQIILKLMAWILEAGWRYYSEIEEGKLNFRVFDIAAELNQASWENLKQQIPSGNLTVDEFIQAEKEIGRGLLTGVCVGALFDTDSRKDFRAPWFDILQGIEELKTFKQFEACLSNYQGDNVEELYKWHQGKTQNLLKVMQQSYQSALKMTPYWA
ncbi:CYTH domain-containing protein [Catenovulum maritimum]|uniref:CYTH domain-containing protein n=1 Tax=Catenovulum maritimum TaxID=1513271 RepID=A0A0J8GUM4_9ALTE|nr:CYTH domain-containing protein [Catenovulum maritimum]KMT64383.1 hypothetical protein XM47_14470 [Catenovulum maritimum]